MFFSETCFTVRYAETDKMGIVHHSNYPVWFEAGRTDFIKKLGMSYSDIEDGGILLPLIELNCRYKSASRYEDEIIVKTTLKELTFSRVTFHYEVFRNSECQSVATGETMHVFTNREIKPVNIKKHAPDIYALLLKALE